MEAGSQSVSGSGEGDGISGETSFWRQTWGSSTRAVLGSFAAIVFGVAILMISIVAVTDPARVYPHEAVEEEMMGQETVTPVEYYLPYPGVLPDSPLYKLKAVRDWVWLRLTIGEEEKSKKELLFADKRINAAVFLVEGGKEALGVSTATKAEKYLSEAIGRVEKLVKEGKDEKSLVNTLIVASAKHLELLESINKKATGDRVEVVGQAWQMTKVAHERAHQALRDSQ